MELRQSQFSHTRENYIAQWLYVIIMSRRRFRVNLHSIVRLNVKELLARSRRHIILKFIWSLNSLKLQFAVTSEFVSHLDSTWQSSSLTFTQTIECRFNLNLVSDMITAYSKMHRTDKYSQQNSTIWPVWLNGWVFNCKLTGCVLESLCSHYIGQTVCYEQN